MNKHIKGRKENHCKTGSLLTTVFLKPVVNEQLKPMKPSKTLIELTCTAGLIGVNGCLLYFFVSNFVWTNIINAIFSNNAEIDITSRTLLTKYVKIYIKLMMAMYFMRVFYRIILFDWLLKIYRFQI